MKKSITSLAIGLLTITLSACGGAESQPAPETTTAPETATAPEETAAPETTAVSEVVTIPKPTEEQAQALRASFAEINPLLDHDGVVDDARNTCQSMLGGIEEANLIRATTMRFTAPGLSDVSEAEAVRIVEVIRANGFCIEG